MSVPSEAAARGLTRSGFEFLRRIRMTGLSILGFGASWTLDESEREKIRELLTYLEDRRALYTDYHLEIVMFVKYSVGEMRSELTDTLGLISANSKAVKPLRGMRAACRNFLTQTQDIHDSPSPDSVRFHNRFGQDLDLLRFFDQLGRLRATFGIHIAHLCDLYHLEVEDQMDGILPASDQSNE